MQIMKSPGQLEQLIHVIRGKKVMLDEDLAALYEVPVKRLNEQVRRNPRRFPDDFSFILTNQEFSNLKSQIATSSSAWGGRRKNPLVFTEQGVAMLSSVLNSGRAIEVNVEIMRAFARLRDMLSSHKDLALKLETLEKKYDVSFKVVFDAIRALVDGKGKRMRKKIGFQ